MHQVEVEPAIDVVEDVVENVVENESYRCYSAIQRVIKPIVIY